MSDKTTEYPIEHVAFYQFEDLSPLEPLRDTLREHAERLGLLGTVLLAQEGINGMLAGSSEAIQQWLDQLYEERPSLSPMPIKRSWCEEQPLQRLVVRLREEIATLRVSGVDAQQQTAPKLSPSELRDWLRAGEELVLVDIRNDFECRLGTFRGALNPKTRAFHEFPDYVLSHREAWRGKKVVTFCTGGIRCEKATSWMMDQGIDTLYQLDGGIINYFQEIPDAEQDWNGELFVFDKRVTLDTKLKPTGRTPEELLRLELALRDGVYEEPSGEPGGEREG